MSEDDHDGNASVPETTSPEEREYVTAAETDSEITVETADFDAMVNAPAETNQVAEFYEIVDEDDFPEVFPDEGAVAFSESVEAEPESAADAESDLRQIRESVGQIQSAQAQLAKDFSAKLKYDANKQEQIDRLYRENQGYREDVIEKFKSQIVLAVIEQIDDAEKQISHFGRQDETEKNYAKLLNCFHDVTVSFQDMLLERFDVSPFQTEPGALFDPKRQRALKTTETSDESQNKTVAASLRPGYEKSDGTLLRPEMVEVFRYRS